MASATATASGAAKGPGRQKKNSLSPVIKKMTASDTQALPTGRVGAGKAGGKLTPTGRKTGNPIPGLKGRADDGREKAIKRALGITLATLGLTATILIPVVIVDQRNRSPYSITQVQSQKQGISVFRFELRKDVGSSLSAINMKGYAFVGYFKNEECTIPLDQSDVLTKGTAIYAQYVEVYTLTIRNGKEKIIHEYRADTTLADTLKAYEGDHFEGWFTDKEFTDPINADEIQCYLNDDLTVYAKYYEERTIYANLDKENIIALAGYPDQTLDEVLAENPGVSFPNNVVWYTTSSFDAGTEVAQNSFATLFNNQTPEIINIYARYTDAIIVYANGTSSSHTYFEDLTLEENLSRFNIVHEANMGRFFKWYSDATFKHEANLTGEVTKPIVVYARYTKALTVYTDLSDQAKTYDCFTDLSIQANLGLLNIEHGSTSGKFEGWYTSGDFETKTNISDKYSTETSIYARYTKTLSVYTDLSEQTKTYDCFTDLSIQENLDLLNIAHLETSGKFEGWYTSNAFETKATLGNQFNTETSIYARYTKVLSVYTDLSDEETEHDCFTDLSIQDNLKLINITHDEASGNFEGWYTSNAFETKADLGQEFNLETSIYARYTKGLTIHANNAVVNEEFFTDLTLSEILANYDASSTAIGTFYKWYTDEAFTTEANLSYKHSDESLEIYARYTTTLVAFFINQSASGESFDCFTDLTLEENISRFKITHNEELEEFAGWFASDLRTAINVDEKYTQPVEIYARYADECTIDLVLNTVEYSLYDISLEMLNIGQQINCLSDQTFEEVMLNFSPDPNNGSHSGWDYEKNQINWDGWYTAHKVELETSSGFLLYQYAVERKIENKAISIRDILGENKNSGYICARDIRFISLYLDGELIHEGYHDWEQTMDNVIRLNVSTREHIAWYNNEDFSSRADTYLLLPYVDNVLYGRIEYYIEFVGNEASLPNFHFAYPAYKNETYGDVIAKLDLGENTFYRFYDEAGNEIDQTAKINGDTTIYVAECVEVTVKFQDKDWDAETDTWPGEGTKYLLEKGMLIGRAFYEEFGHTLTVIQTVSRDGDPWGYDSASGSYITVDETWHGDTIYVRPYVNLECVVWADNGRSYTTSAPVYTIGAYTYRNVLERISYYYDYYNLYADAEKTQPIDWDSTITDLSATVYIEELSRVYINTYINGDDNNKYGKLTAFVDRPFPSISSPTEPPYTWYWDEECTQPVDMSFKIDSSYANSTIQIYAKDTLIYIKLGEDDISAPWFLNNESFKDNFPEFYDREDFVGFYTNENLRDGLIDPETRVSDFNYSLIFPRYAYDVMVSLNTHSPINIHQNLGTITALSDQTFAEVMEDYNTPVGITSHTGWDNENNCVNLNGWYMWPNPDEPSSYTRVSVDPSKTMAELSNGVTNIEIGAYITQYGEIYIDGELYEGRYYSVIESYDDVLPKPAKNTTYTWYETANYQDNGEDFPGSTSAPYFIGSSTQSGAIYARTTYTLTISANLDLSTTTTLKAFKDQSWTYEDALKQAFGLYYPGANKIHTATLNGQPLDINSTITQSGEIFVDHVDAHSCGIEFIVNGRPHLFQYAYDFELVTDYLPESLSGYQWYANEECTGQPINFTGRTIAELLPGGACSGTTASFYAQTTSVVTVVDGESSTELTLKGNKTLDQYSEIQTIMNSEDFAGIWTSADFSGEPINLTTAKADDFNGQTLCVRRGFTVEIEINQGRFSDQLTETAYTDETYREFLTRIGYSGYLGYDWGINLDAKVEKGVSLYVEAFTYSKFTLIKVQDGVQGTPQICEDFPDEPITSWGFDLEENFIGFYNSYENGVFSDEISRDGTIYFGQLDGKTIYARYAYEVELSLYFNEQGHHILMQTITALSDQSFEESFASFDNSNAPYFHAGWDADNNCIRWSGWEWETAANDGYGTIENPSSIIKDVVGENITSIKLISYANELTEVYLDGKLTKIYDIPEAFLSMTLRKAAGENYSTDYAWYLSYNDGVYSGEVDEDYLSNNFSVSAGKIYGRSCHAISVYEFDMYEGLETTPSIEKSVIGAEETYRDLLSDYREDDYMGSWDYDRIYKIYADAEKTIEIDLDATADGTIKTIYVDYVINHVIVPTYYLNGEEWYQDAEGVPSFEPILNWAPSDYTWYYDEAFTQEVQPGDLMETWGPLYAIEEEITLEGLGANADETVIIACRSNDTLAELFGQYAPSDNSFGYFYTESGLVVDQYGYSLTSPEGIDLNMTLKEFMSEGEIDENNAITLYMRSYCKVNLAGEGVSNPGEYSTLADYTWQMLFDTMEGGGMLVFPDYFDSRYHHHEYRAKGADGNSVDAFEEVVDGGTIEVYITARFELYINGQYERMSESDTLDSELQSHIDFENYTWYYDADYTELANPTDAYKGGVLYGRTTYTITLYDTLNGVVDETKNPIILKSFEDQNETLEQVIVRTYPTFGFDGALHVLGIYKIYTDSEFKNEVDFTKTISSSANYYFDRRSNHLVEIQYFLNDNLLHSYNEYDFETISDQATTLLQTHTCYWDENCTVKVADDDILSEKIAQYGSAIYAKETSLNIQLSDTETDSVTLYNNESVGLNLAEYIERENFVGFYTNPNLRDGLVDLDSRVGDFNGQTFYARYAYEVEISLSTHDFHNVDNNLGTISCYSDQTFEEVITEKYTSNNTGNYHTGWDEANNCVNTNGWFVYENDECLVMEGVAIDPTKTMNELTNGSTSIKIGAETKFYVEIYVDDELYYGGYESSRQSWANLLPTDKENYVWYVDNNFIYAHQMSEIGWNHVSLAYTLHGYEAHEFKIYSLNADGSTGQEWKLGREGIITEAQAQTYGDFVEFLDVNNELFENYRIYDATGNDITNTNITDAFTTTVYVRKSASFTLVNVVDGVITSSQVYEGHPDALVSITEPTDKNFIGYYWDKEFVDAHKTSLSGRTYGQLANNDIPIATPGIVYARYTETYSIFIYGPDTPISGEYESYKDLNETYGEFFTRYGVNLDDIYSIQNTSTGKDLSWSDKVTASAEIEVVGYTSSNVYLNGELIDTITGITYYDSVLMRLDGNYKWYLDEACTEELGFLDPGGTDAYAVSCVLNLDFGSEVMSISLNSNISLQDVLSRDEVLETLRGHMSPEVAFAGWFLSYRDYNPIDSSLMVKDYAGSSVTLYARYQYYEDTTIRLWADSGENPTYLAVGRAYTDETLCDFGWRVNGWFPGSWNAGFSYSTLATPGEFTGSYDDSNGGEFKGDYI